VGSKSIGILYSEATLQNNTIVNNSAGEGWGGGVCLYDPENTLIENTVIARNHADLQGGGGMHVNWVRCNVLNLQNCSFVANSAYLSGGGLSALYGGSSQVCNTAPLHIANTIFSENQIENLEGASEISVDNRDGSTPAIIGYSAISGGISSTNCQGVVKPGVGNIDCIPDFLSSTNYQIGSGSNCIDRGTAVESPTTDLEGKMRYDEPSHPNLPSFIDIGAYEYNP
jgi:parallel beta-helix repeat protein